MNHRECFILVLLPPALNVDLDELDWPQLSFTLVVVCFINSSPSNKQLGSGFGDLVEPYFFLGSG